MEKFEYTMGKELDLKSEQAKTLATPVLKANLFLKILYILYVHAAAEIMNKSEI